MQFEKLYLSAGIRYKLVKVKGQENIRLYDDNRTSSNPQIIMLGTPPTAIHMVQFFKN